MIEKNGIYKIYGTDYKEMTKTLLEEGDARSLIPSETAHIGIKPNLVSPSTPDMGAVTHPEIIAGIIEYLRDNDFADIYVMESSWVGARTADVFALSGLDKVCEAYGVPFYDIKKDKYVRTDCAGMDISISERALRTDFLINVPVLKGHCQTGVTCALKNMKGLLPDKEKRLFHVRGLHRPIAHLNTAVRQSLIVVDNILGDPDYEDGGNPVVRNMIMLTRDPVLTDTYAARFLGLDPGEVAYIAMACGLGVGSMDLAGAAIRVVRETAAWRDVDFLPPSGRVDMRDKVEELCSCSACYGALVPALERLKEEGFTLSSGEKIAVGQGYRGKTGPLGVGNCTLGFDICIPGCPPEKDEIYKGLKNIFLNRPKS